MTTGNTPATWLNKLPQLSHLLNKGGLPVGTDTWIRIYDLLLAKQQQQSLPENPKDLQWSLSGLIATSEDQQQRFNTLYQQWLIDIGYGEAITRQKQRQQQKHQREWEKRQRKQRQNKSIWKVIALAVTLFAAIAIATYYLQPRPEPPKPTPKPEKTTTTSPKAPAKSPIALQPTPIRTDLLPKEEIKPTAQQAWLLERIKHYLPFLPALLLSLWELAKWLRWKEVLRQQKGDPNDPLSHISINNTPDNHEQKLFNSPVLSRALRALHNTIKCPSRQLAIEATAEATARAAGYFTPVYQQRPYVPPTILMISYQHGRDQATGLALLLQQRLQHAGLEVHTYLFQGTPQRLLPLGEQRWQTLEHITRHYTQANLLLISEPDLYLSNWSGRLQPWTQTLDHWQQRALLYTRPPTADMLKAFAQLSLQCAPLSSEGLRHISQQFAGVIQTSTPLQAPPQPILPPVLARLTASDCHEEPDQETRQQQIKALKDYCTDEDERYLLSVIAAYPELHWTLTQRLEHELFANDSAIQREQRLLHLLRLPWLRFGQIPKWLRHHLHQQQDKAQRRRTGQIYRQLFEEAQINREGKLQLPFNPHAQNTKNNRALLRWLKTLKQAHSNSGKDSIWEDQIFATTLLGKKHLDLDMLLPKALAKRIPQGRWRTLYPRLALILLLSVFLGSLLQQGWQRYGEQLAQDYWIQNPQLRQQLATLAINIQISKPEHFKTGADMQRYEQQKQAAEILKAALQTQGFKGKLSINIQQGKPENPNRPSRIQYAPQNKLAAAIIARQLKHLGWGLQANMETLEAQQGRIQIQLNQLTQAATTFSDTAKPLTAEQKTALAKPVNKENPPAMPAFTLFRDSPVQKNNKTASIPLPTMIVLPAGEFLMGAPDDESERYGDEFPQHRVKLKAFAISQTEITFAQYDAFAKATGRALPDDAGFGRGQRPVINVSWNDATAYVQWLSEQTGQAYRLPSEAEWEYAARAGTRTPFSTGDCIHTDLANYHGDFDYNHCGAETGVYREQTLPVTELPANPWGLFGVHGNVWEWVEDCYHEDYRGAPADGSAWQEAGCDRRVFRGGSWSSDPVLIRSALRNRLNPDDADYFAGFRIARAL